MLLELPSCRSVREELKIQTLSLPWLWCMKQKASVYTHKSIGTVWYIKMSNSFEDIKHRHCVQPAILIWILFLSSPDYFQILRRPRSEAENSGNEYLAPLIIKDSLKNKSELAKKFYKLIYFMLVFL